MSFLSEKLTSIMQRPGEDPVAKEDVPWYMKYGGRIVGTLGGFLALLFGGLSCLGILFLQASSFIAGAVTMVTGFIILVIEAPCFCMFIEPVQGISDFVDKRPYWNRAVLYFGLAIAPFFIKPEAGQIFGSGLIFATGVIYGMMSIGKKGSGLDGAGLPTSVVGSPQEQMPPGSHHTTLMEDPDVWRPT